MSTNKLLKSRLFSLIFGCFFVLISLFAGIFTSTPVYADPTEEPTHITTETTEETTAETTTTAVNTTTGTDSCQSSLGALGWLVCPTTGKIAEAVDWLYDKIEGILIINPISAEDGSPIYEIWKYCLGVANSLFIVFLLIVIYSQLTGLGITNYGVKKAMPKLIVVAILVNLSFLICSLGIEVSNIVGGSLRGLFTGVEEASIASGAISQTANVSYSSLYSALAGGGALTIGAGVIAFETGAIWMLIPVVLGALVAVASGLITIALRQAVVILLVMISPLAIVAYMLPNTEHLFRKWKDLLTRMLVFYPMFSLLFGASNLAGWAIIASAQDGFTILLGVAVQIFPLFFSWSLMKMSGTFLGSINSGIRNLAARPLATNRAWAQSHRDLTRAQNLAKNRNDVYTPSLRLQQFLSDRQISRMADTKEAMDTVRNRGLAYNAQSHYNKDGTVSSDGERAYEMQARNMRYQQVMTRDRNNFNGGLGMLNGGSKDAAQRARLHALDMANVNASDNLKYELARGAKIDYENAKGFHNRTTQAMNAHLDVLNANNPNYKFHNTTDTDLERYNSILQTMEGNVQDVHFAAADAAYSFNSQAKIVDSKFRTYYDLTPATQDVVRKISELSNRAESNNYIDSIVAGMKTLNQRGDTDLVKKILDETIGARGQEKIDLGTYASQSLANFLMFEVKDNDPLLRRFGKYINLETAHVYNENSEKERRHNTKITFDEYLNGEYVETDDNGMPVIGENGMFEIKKSKKPATVLMKGTSFKTIERTALQNMTDSIKKVCTDENGHVDQDKFEKLQTEIDDAIFPNLIGDSLTFLSGSEQITALANYLSGFKEKDGKQKASWPEISDADEDNMTQEEIDALRERKRKFHLARTEKFINGHVPSQMGRFKSDIFAAISKGLYLDQAKSDYAAIHGQEAADQLTDDQYKELTMEHDGVMGGKERFKKALKPQAYDYLVKMNRKGYLSDAKAPIVEYLNLDNVPDPETTRRSRTHTAPDDDDEDDGILPQRPGEAGGTNNAANLQACLASLDIRFGEYQNDRRTGADDVRYFYEDAADIVMEHLGSASILRETGAGLGAFTDVATLYTHIQSVLQNSRN